MNTFSGGGHTNLVSQWKSIENILYYNQYISVKCLTLKFKFQVKSSDPPPLQMLRYVPERNRPALIFTPKQYLN
jgi:hypothetical protein